MRIAAGKAGSCPRRGLIHALLASCIFSLQLCLGKSEEIALPQQNAILAKDRIQGQKDGLQRRTKVMSSNALGVLVLGSTILGSTAVIRHATHMHLLPPSVRHTFDIADSNPSPIVYKITQDELKQLELQRNEADGEADKQKREDLSMDMEKRAMSGKNVATFSALAGLGGYLVRAWNHPPQRVSYEKREIEERTDQIFRRSPKVYSTGKAAGLIALAGAAGWFAQVANHEAPDEFPNGRREKAAGAVDDQLVRRSDAWKDVSTPEMADNTTVTFDQVVPSVEAYGEQPLPQWPSSRIIKLKSNEADQVNSASTARVGAPKGMLWQKVLIALGAIFFLSSFSTASAANRDISDLSTVAHGSTVVRGIAASKQQPDSNQSLVRRGYPSLPSYMANVPSPATSPFVSTQSSESSWLEPHYTDIQPEIPSSTLQRMPPWDGRITRQDQKDAHNRWSDEAFLADLDTVSRNTEGRAANRAGESTCNGDRWSTLLSYDPQTAYRKDHEHRKMLSVAPSTQNGMERRPAGSVRYWGNATPAPESDGNWDFDPRFRRPHTQVKPPLNSDTEPAPAPGTRKLPYQQEPSIVQHAGPCSKLGRRLGDAMIGAGGTGLCVGTILGTRRLINAARSRNRRLASAETRTPSEEGNLATAVTPLAAGIGSTSETPRTSSVQLSPVRQTKDLVRRSLRLEIEAGGHRA